MKTQNDSNNASKGDLWDDWDYYLNGHIQFTIFDEAQNLKPGGTGERSKDLLPIRSHLYLSLTGITMVNSFKDIPGVVEPLLPQDERLLHEVLGVSLDVNPFDQFADDDQGAMELQREENGRTRKLQSQYFRHYSQANFFTPFEHLHIDATRTLRIIPTKANQLSSKERHRFVLCELDDILGQSGQDLGFDPRHQNLLDEQILDESAREL